MVEPTVPGGQRRRIPERYFRHDVALGLLRLGGHEDGLIVGLDGETDRPRVPGSSGPAGTFGCSYLFHGTGWFVDRRGVRHQLSAGSMYLILPDADQTWQHHVPHYATCYFCLWPETYQRLRAAGLLRTDPQVTHGAPDLRIVARYAELIQTLRGPSPGASMRPMLEALALMDLLQSRGESADLRTALEPARLRLCQDLARPLALPALAADLGCSYDDFRRRFRRAFGVSPGEYRIRRRLERACALLRGSRVDQVAAELGYCDAFAFSKQFKAHMGVSPSRYRETIGAGG